MEMAVLFPLVLMSILILLQTGMGLAYQGWVKSLADRSLMIVQSAVEKGEDLTQAQDEADVYLSARIPSMSAQSLSWEWEGRQDFIRTSCSIRMSGTCTMFYSQRFQIQCSRNVIDPALFRNRTDLIYEKVKQWYEEK